MIMNMRRGAAASSKLLSALNVGDTLEVPVARMAASVWRISCGKWRTKTTPDTRPIR